MVNPEVCILKTDGINCDMEMAHAFEVAGANPETVHINQLRSGERHLRDFGALAIPGGFSYGDDVVSGKILATELTSYLSDQLSEFVDGEKPILGVCNGFQTLVRTGLLPNRTLGEQQVTLAENDIGQFVCRWIDLKVEDSICQFIDGLDGLSIPMQTAHGEGKFFASDEDIKNLNKNEQVAFRYSTPESEEAEGYPQNPNGALENIAGICDPTGLILGMMPHPERSIEAFHPHRIRTEQARTAAKMIFNNIVQFTRSA